MILYFLIVTQSVSMSLFWFFFFFSTRNLASSHIFHFMLNPHFTNLTTSSQCCLLILISVYYGGIDRNVNKKGEAVYDDIKIVKQVLLKSGTNLLQIL